MFTAFRAFNLNTTSPAPQMLSELSPFPVALRGLRVVFLLLMQFSSELETEADVILTPLIKLFIGKTDAGEPRPGWMRVPVMKIMDG
jgi:hypothetical protein